MDDDDDDSTGIDLMQLGLRVFLQCVDPIENKLTNPCLYHI